MSRFWEHSVFWNGYVRKENQRYGPSCTDSHVYNPVFLLPFQQEDSLKQAMQVVSSDVEKKLDKEEVGPLKNFLEARLKAMRPKPPATPPKEELAAGFCKPLLPNFSCISCARPVKYARDGMFPALPTVEPMPGAKSSRPYTTFELEQIRQHMLQGGLGMTKDRFEVLEKQRQKLQKEILKLR